MTDARVTHIADVDISTIAVGDHVEQAGATYQVTEIRRSQYFNGVEAIFYTWTGSEESDTFRSIVNSKDAIGQVRWEAPYRKPEGVEGHHVSLKVTA